jgi:GDPmannose 4,6-dehydratase
VSFLLGDASKARARLGWQPGTTFEQLVREMVEADCQALGVAAPEASSAAVA